MCRPAYRTISIVDSGQWTVESEGVDLVDYLKSFAEQIHSLSTVNSQLPTGFLTHLTGRATRPLQIILHLFSILHFALCISYYSLCILYFLFCVFCFQLFIFLFQLSVFYHFQWKIYAA